MRFQVRVARIWYRLIKLVTRLLGIKRTVYVQERVGFYRDMWRSAAEELGLDFRSLGESFWEVRDGGRTVARLHNYIASLDDPVTLDMAGDKLLVYRLFAEAGLPIPGYVSATMETLGGIGAFVASHRGPFVVKPARNTASGLGVTTNVHSAGQALRAAALAFGYCDEILIEEHIVGESYRLLFLGHRMLCASRRAGIRVAGDGVSRLEQLMTAASVSGGSLHGMRWRGDPNVALTLERQGLTLSSVPEEGKVVLVRSAGSDVRGNSEIRTVYTEDVTEVVSEQVIDAARQASLALGSSFCGVDIITVDPTVSLGASGGVISEINTTPGLHHHYGLEPNSVNEPLAVTVLRHMSRG